MCRRRSVLPLITANAMAHRCFPVEQYRQQRDRRWDRDLQRPPAGQGHRDAEGGCRDRTSKDRLVESIDDYGDHMHAPHKDLERRYALSNTKTQCTTYPDGFLEQSPQCIDIVPSPTRKRVTPPSISACTTTLLTPQPYKKKATKSIILYATLYRHQRMCSKRHYLYSSLQLFFPSLVQHFTKHPCTHVSLIVHSLHSRSLSMRLRESLRR